MSEVEQKKKRRFWQLHLSTVVQASSRIGNPVQTGETRPAIDQDRRVEAGGSSHSSTAVDHHRFGGGESVGSEETSDVALLPIKPKFANAIMDGSKRVEFRKVKFQRNVRHVVVYASSPISKVVGYFTVAGIDEGSPTELWQKYEAVGGIAEQEFREYYRSAASAIAINVGEVKTLRKPVRLASLKRNLTAPQSFAYLDATILGKLRPSRGK